MSLGQRSVKVTVMQARGLRAKGKDGTSDTFATIQVGKDKFATAVCAHTLTPSWREEASFPIPLLHPDNTERCALRVQLLHRGALGVDKVLGQVVLNLLQLEEDTSRQKTQWHKLISKAGKADKERGEVQLDIQFMRSNMTASMFDLSTQEKSRSTMGKLKDKLHGKKKDGVSDSASAIVPSVTLSDSEGEDDAQWETPGGTQNKSKLKSLFAPKTNLERNVSQSMSALGSFPEAETSALSSSSSGIHVDSPEEKKKFTLLTHKRSGSSEGKASHSPFSALSRTKASAAEVSGVCINGSHVYNQENKSQRSSGPGSAEDVHNKNPPAVKVELWEEREEDEEEQQKVREKRSKEEEARKQEDERRKQEDEKKRRREEQEERLRLQQENVRKQEETKKKEEELRQEKIRKEEEERIRLEKIRKEEEDRIKQEKIRKEKEEEIIKLEKRKKEEERIRLEKVRMEEETRKREEERKKEEERARQERIRKEEARAELEKRKKEEEEIIRLEKLKKEEKIRLEKKVEEEKLRKQEEERKKQEEKIRQEVKKEEEMEEERIRLKKKQEEVEEMKKQEKRKLHEEKVETRQKEGEERARQENQRREEMEKIKKADEQRNNLERVNKDKASKISLYHSDKGEAVVAGNPFLESNTFEEKALEDVQPPSGRLSRVSAVKPRRHPVKPQFSPETQLVHTEMPREDVRVSSVLAGVLGKPKEPIAGAEGPYSQLTREELVDLVVKQQAQLVDKQHKVEDLEEYIDHLLVRVMEEKPSILMSMSSVRKAHPRRV